MKAVLMKYEPTHKDNKQMEADIKTVSGLDVWEYWNGKIRYRPRNMYFKCNDSDLVYLVMKYGNEVVQTGKQIELYHKQMGI